MSTPFGLRTHSYIYDRFSRCENLRDLGGFEDDDFGIACTTLRGFLLPTPGERERQITTSFFHDRRLTREHTARGHRRRPRDAISIVRAH